MHEYYQKLFNQLKINSCIRKTILLGNNIGEESIFLNGKEQFSTKKDLSFTENDLTETLVMKPHLVLYGAGHIALALYRLARLQSMPVTILDDRKEFANKERFPEADIHCDPFPTLLSHPLSIPGAYHVITTSGHLHDEECLAFALKEHSPYVGMIGSKGKVAATYAHLESKGYAEEELSLVHSPIGLPIGGDSPEEIAISIMAEIIQSYAKDKHRTLIEPKTIEAIAESDEDGWVLRVLEKEGSSPAVPGAMLFVTKTEAIGTIGGGAIEKQAIVDARNSHQNHIETYDLSPEGNLGMACGGKVKVLFSRV
jgi:xanthine dehydrogenase accessory factor